MSRDATGRAQQASRMAVSDSNKYGGLGDSLQAQLTPIYSQMATNPQGMTPGEISDARTASMQSVGGSVAGATGEGNLEAARTGNAGGYQAALRDAARRGIATNANNALKVQNMNTALKETQRTQGLAGLHSLQSQDQSDALKALGIDVGAVNAETEAGKSGWFQNMNQLIQSLTGAANAYANVRNSGGGGGNGMKAGAAGA